MPWSPATSTVPTRTDFSAGTGTDWPHPNVGRFMPNDGDLVDLISEIAPDEVQREKLLVKNPANLYGWASGNRA